jgi:hypothetical protein
MSLKLRQHNLLASLLLPMAILKSSGPMLELAVMVSLSASAGRGSGTVSITRKTVLVSTILPTTTTSDRT